MNQSEAEKFIAQLPGVEQAENFGHIFFFVGADHRLPFATIGHSDNDFDKVSNLNREGVFRMNIGVSKETYDSLFKDFDFQNIDYAVLDAFLPHPHYAKQHYLCILSPSGKNEELTRQLILEAHAMAAARRQRKTSI